MLNLARLPFDPLISFKGKTSSRAVRFRYARTFQVFLLQQGNESVSHPDLQNRIRMCFCFHRPVQSRAMDIQDETHQNVWHHFCLCLVFEGNVLRLDSLQHINTLYPSSSQRLTYIHMSRQSDVHSPERSDVPAGLVHFRAL